MERRNDSCDKPDGDINLKLKKAFESYLWRGPETDHIREYRKQFERYYLYDDISESEFLELCDRFVDEMIENEKELTTGKPEFFRLDGYIRDLQSLTHKRPSERHGWPCYFVVTSKAERYRYYDACDKAFRMDMDDWKLSILKPDGNGGVKSVKPSEYERSIFWRHWHDCNVITEEIAYKLALNPALSY